MLSKRVINLKPSITLEITAKANALKKQGVDVVGFGAGEPDFDTPEFIKEAAIKAIKDGKTRYTPVAGIPELRKAVAEFFCSEYKVDFNEDEILISCGGKHSLYNIFQTLLDKEDEVIIPSPYWVSYPPMVELAEGKPVIVNTSYESGYKLKVDDLKKAITSKTKAIIINSPSNPTGSAYSEEELRELLDIIVDKEIYIISDDIYSKIIYDDYKFINALMLYPEYKDKIIIATGVSKTYAMTGWRIGFTGANKNIISAMSKIQGQSTSNPTSIAQYAALAAIKGDQSFIANMLEEFNKRRNYIVNELNTIEGVKCFKPIGAFYVFPDISNVLARMNYNSSVDFAKDLLDKEKVALVPGDAFGYKNGIRLSYATSFDIIKKGLERIKNFIQ